jgi:hypothetical protein
MLGKRAASPASLGRHVALVAVLRGGEVFHAFVCVAAACQFAAITRLAG